MPISTPGAGDGTRTGACDLCIAANLFKDISLIRHV
jgi:hypothetical protein